MAGLSDHLLEELSANAEPRTYAAGEYLMRQGEASHQLLVIGSGEARAGVRRMPGGDSEELGLLAAGDVAGEIGLLTDETRKADVVAEKPLRAFLSHGPSSTPWHCDTRSSTQPWWSC